MSDKRIDQLDRAAAAADGDLLILQANGIAKYIQVLDLFKRALVGSNNLNDVDDPAVALGNLNGLSSVEITDLINDVESKLFNKHRIANLVGGLFSDISKTSTSKSDVILSGCEYTSNTVVSEGYVVINSDTVSETPTLYYLPESTVNATATYYFVPDDSYNNSTDNDLELVLRCKLVATAAAASNTSSRLTPTISSADYNSLELVIKALIKPDLVNLQPTVPSGNGFAVSSNSDHVIRALKKADGEVVLSGGLRNIIPLQDSSGRDLFTWNTSILANASSYQKNIYPVTVLRNNTGSIERLNNFNITITNNRLTILGDLSGGSTINSGDVVIFDGIRFNTN